MYSLKLDFNTIVFTRPWNKKKKTSIFNLTQVGWRQVQSIFYFTPSKERGLDRIKLNLKISVGYFNAIPLIKLNFQINLDCVIPLFLVSCRLFVVKLRRYQRLLAGNMGK